MSWRYVRRLSFSCVTTLDVFSPFAAAHQFMFDFEVDVQA
jgi:hypothetical protein